MRKKRYGTYIPKDLDLDVLLIKHPPVERLKNNRLAYLIGLIIWLPLVNDKVKKDNGYVALMSIKIEEKIGRYNRYMNWLEDVGIIERDGSWQEGVEPMGYRITSNYDQLNLKRVEFTDKLIVRKFEESSEVALRDRRKYNYLWKHFKLNRLTIDRDACVETIKKYRYSDGYLYLIDKIVDHQWNFKISGEGKRLYTNLTNLKKDFRRHLRYDGEALYEIDIKASQPYFFVMMVCDHLNDKIGRENVSKLISVANGESGMSEDDIDSFLKSFTLDLGDVYQYFKWVRMGWIYPVHNSDIKANGGYNWEDDADVKESFYRVLFGEWNNWSQEVQVFKKSYPTISRIMQKIKGSDHRQLAIGLQLIESNAVLDIVCKRVADELPDAPIYTIHDSILTTKEYQHQLSQIMADELLKIVGIKPILRLK